MSPQDRYAVRENVLLVYGVEHPLVEAETGHPVLELTDFEPSGDPRAVWKRSDDDSVERSTKSTLMLDQADVSEAVSLQGASSDSESTLWHGIWSDREEGLMRLLREGTYEQSSEGEPEEEVTDYESTDHAGGEVESCLRVGRRLESCVH